MNISAPSSGRFSALSRTAVLACGSLLSVSSLALPAALFAQDQSPRTIEGKVVNKDNGPLKGAVVYLKDGHTLAVKSYIAGDDGGYRFGQISSTGDYTLWAESDGKKSSTRSVSPFDPRTRVEVTLKIDK